MNWTDDQLERKALAEQGKTVVASKRGIRTGNPRDEALIAWARQEGRAVAIHRNTKWGNPYRMPKDGDRHDCIRKFRRAFKRNPGLHAQLPELRGKVLVCWCYPDPCHGDVIAHEANHYVEYRAYE